MWNDFFLGDVDIIGVDILPECKRFEGGNIRVLVGDQSDDSFLEMLSNQVGELDIIVDDGSHICSHQIATFETLFYKNLKPSGIYFVEDCHTSYRPNYGGGLRRRGSFIEYAKKLCDDVNAWHARNPGLPVTHATQWISAITFASSIVIIEKQQMSAPEVVESGVSEINTEDVFGGGRLGRVLSYLRQFAALRYVVRRNRFLWVTMRKLIDKSNKSNLR
jgi:hypothetical protein